MRSNYFITLKIIMRAFFFTINFFLFSACLSQNLDKQLKDLQYQINITKEDSLKVNLLLDLYWHYYNYESNKDSMIAISYKTIKLAKQHNFNIALSKAYGNLGKAYRLNKVLDSSLYYNTLSYNVAKEINNQNLIAASLLKLGGYYITANNLSKAIEYLIEATELAESVNNESIMAEAYYKLAYAFGFTDNVKKEKYYIDKAFNLAQNKNLSIPNSVRSSIYTEKMYYFERQRFKNPENLKTKDSLLFYINKNDAFGKSINNAGLIVSALTLKGKMFYNNNELKQALKYYQKALHYKGRINQIDLINVYNNLAHTYIDDNQINLALKYKDTILTYLKNESNHRSKGELFRTAYYITKHANKPNLALEYHEKMTANLNKAKEEKQITSLNELEIKYESKKKDAEIASRKLENETLKRKAITNYFTISVLGLLGLGFLGFLYFKKKNKALTAELDLAETKVTLHRSQLNPHFISNSINAIYPFLYDKSNPNKAAAYLSNLSQMMRSMLDSTFDDSWTIKEEIDFIQQYCNIQNLKMDVPFILNVVCDESLKDKKIPSLITQTFIENCFVHGFANKLDEAAINITFTNEDDKLQIQITDNGEATEKQNNLHTSRSNSIVRQRILNAYSKKNLSKEFLTFGKIKTGYQVTIKLPINL